MSTCATCAVAASARAQVGQLLVRVRKAQLPGSHSALHMAQQLLRHDLIRRQQVGQQAPQLQLLAPVRLTSACKGMGLQRLSMSDHNTAQVYMQHVMPAYILPMDRRPNDRGAVTLICLLHFAH